MIALFASRGLTAIDWTRPPFAALSRTSAPASGITGGICCKGDETQPTAKAEIAQTTTKRSALAKTSPLAASATEQRVRNEYSSDAACRLTSSPAEYASTIRGYQRRDNVRYENSEKFGATDSGPWKINVLVVPPVAFSAFSEFPY